MKRLQKICSIYYILESTITFKVPKLLVVYSALLNSWNNYYIYQNYILHKNANPSIWLSL